MSDLSARVASLAGYADDATCQEAVDIMTALARVQTRSRGFEVAPAAEAIAAVIVVAAARLLGNPQQVDDTTGPLSTRGGFVGWSIVELLVLNSYRGTAV